MDRLALALACSGVNERRASGRTSARLKSTPLTTVKLERFCPLAVPSAERGTAFPGVGAFIFRQNNPMQSRIPFSGHHCGAAVAPSRQPTPRKRWRECQGCPLVTQAWNARCEVECAPRATTALARGGGARVTLACMKAFPPDSRLVQHVRPSPNHDERAPGLATDEPPGCSTTPA